MKREVVKCGCSLAPHVSEREHPGEPNEVFYNRISHTCQCEDEPPYQQAELPEDAVLAGSSPVMTEKTVPAAIRKKHMAPKGKIAQLIVSSGSLHFVWEDTGEIFRADPGHPILIEAERYHSVELTGPVRFQVNFYDVPNVIVRDEQAVRPGEHFLKKK